MANPGEDEPTSRRADETQSSRRDDATCRMDRRSRGRAGGPRDARLTNKQTNKHGTCYHLFRFLRVYRTRYIMI